MSRAAISVAFIGILMVACQFSSDAITLSESDNGGTIVVGVGDKIEVALHVVGPFYYGQASVSSNSVRFVRQWDEVPAQPPPGGPKTQKYLFEATATGRAFVTILREIRGAAASGFSITVEVY
jgi:hypothetical protein